MSDTTYLTGPAPDTILPARPTPPVSPPKPWYRRRAVQITGGALAALIAIGIGRVAGSSTSHAAAAPSKPATSAPAGPASLALSASDIIRAWAAAGGYTHMTTIAADLGQVAKDSGALNLDAVIQDGTKMTADAQAALAGQPPASLSRLTQPYDRAMSDLVAAGHDLAQGDLSGIQAASPLMSGAITAIQQASSYINSL